MQIIGHHHYYLHSFYVCVLMNMNHCYYYFHLIELISYSRRFRFLLRCHRLLSGLRRQCTDQLYLLNQDSTKKKYEYLSDEQLLVCLTIANVDVDSVGVIGRGNDDDVGDPFVVDGIST